MVTTRRNLFQQIIADFAARHIQRPSVLIPVGKKDDADLTALGVASTATVAMPDFVIHDQDRDWLFLIDASTMRRCMTPKTRGCIEDAFFRERVSPDLVLRLS